MAEEVGHGPDIHACKDELVWREVTEVMEMHVGCSDSVAGPDEERCHLVRPEWRHGFDERREDEGVFGERSSGFGDSLLDSLTVGSEEAMPTGSRATLRERSVFVLF
jgi:hypothetical protein